MADLGIADDGRNVLKNAEGQLHSLGGHEVSAGEQEVNGELAFEVGGVEVQQFHEGVGEEGL
ncbi:hypothetical protein F8S09_15075 [Deinococcus sp. SDU3-2]|uniref:Uncharacterized protein n=1 Tax=Deinococcus terrestris TaxID=2651870 RepID=A0A7X1NY67_9DEIO|nr:hypothetical protein [Deinococcus terrestris]MPY67982.1 hypothetical protein [Deinococcus terrestris]